MHALCTADKQCLHVSPPWARTGAKIRLHSQLGGGVSITPPIEKPTDPSNPSTGIPMEPELPPLQPVPMPDGARLLIAALLAFAILRRAAQQGCHPQS